MGLNNLVKKVSMLLPAMLVLPLLVIAPTVSAADSTVVITGSTSLGENQPGWYFNRDVSTSTPFEFTEDEASLGEGSVFVKPITNTNAVGAEEPKDKFVAELFRKTLVSDVNSYSYDFLIGQGSSVDDADQFYLNVYANIDDTDKFYDCRYDYVPTTGSLTEFTTATFNSTDVPTAVVRSGSSRLEVCPATLAEMPEGSYVRAISVSVGDTGANDTGLSGYVDNVVVDLDSGVTTYDFELNLPPTFPVDKDDCKNGGWKTFTGETFKNQGDCVSYVNGRRDNKKTVVNNTTKVKVVSTNPQTARSGDVRGGGNSGNATASNNSTNTIRVEVGTF